MLNDMHYDLIIFTETWLNNSVTNAMLNQLNLYTDYRLDSPDNARGYGIIVYININFNSLCMTEFLQMVLNYYILNFLITDLSPFIGYQICHCPKLFYYVIL